MARSQDLLGKVFSYLTVVGWEGNNSGRGNVWLCKCKCGNEILAYTSQLNSGNVTSCGCKRKDISAKHYHSDSPTYKSWEMMIQRCTNPNHDEYKNYGARNITVCDRWKSFENFLNDMGNKPVDKSLDRIDNNGNYEPLNCKWSSVKEQAYNTRCKGYSWRKNARKWSAQIMVDGKYIHLGYFIFEEDAENAYLEAKRIYHHRDDRPEVVKRLHNCWDRLYSAI